MNEEIPVDLIPITILTDEAIDYVCDDTPRITAHEFSGDELTLLTTLVHATAHKVGEVIAQGDSAISQNAVRYVDDLIDYKFDQYELRAEITRIRAIAVTCKGAGMDTVGSYFQQMVQRALFELGYSPPGTTRLQQGESLIDIAQDVVVALAPDLRKLHQQDLESTGVNPKMAARVAGLVDYARPPNVDGFSARLGQLYGTPERSIYDILDLTEEGTLPVPVGQYNHEEELRFETSWDELGKMLQEERE